MQHLIQRLLPPDPPLSPMTFTRLPVVHRFWAGGLVAAVLGLVLGFLLWLWQQGLLPAPDEYAMLKTWHAQMQILLFVGSFLLGFALQSGPHVVGGQPPPSHSLLWLLPLLWIGFTLTVVMPNTWVVIAGKALISAAYGGAVYFLLKITLRGDPLRRLARGLPLAASFVPLAITPWLALDNVDLALLVLWCGPVTSALVAGQQLIQNVLGGTFLLGRMARLFAVTLLLAWLLSGIAAVTTWGSWRLAGLAWLLVLAILSVGTGFFQAVWRFGYKSITVTLVLGLGGAFVCALLLLLYGNLLPLDVVVHLLGAGTLVTLIFGVVARVVSFFSGNAALNDRLLVYLLLVWSSVAITRSITPLGWSNRSWVLAMSIVGCACLLLWAYRVGARLWQIRCQIPPEFTGRKKVAPNM